LFALNFALQSKIQHVDSDIHDEEFYFDFAKGVGMNGAHRYYSSNFAHKLMNTLPKSESISRDDLSQSLRQVLGFYSNRKSGEPFSLLEAR